MAPVAPLVAGHWPRRLGGLPGPYAGPGGSGDSPSGQVLQVELFVGGLWVDITSYVMTRDGSYRVDISRGQPNEATRADPGRCSVQLNNRDGRFSPRNPTGPYYGQLRRNQPIRVSVPSGNSKSYRFHGEVPEWPQHWDTTGSDVWVEVQAAGILRRLGQGSAPLRSTMYRGLTSPSLADPPVAYWPCEDAAGATSIASGIGGPPMTILGTANLHASTVFAASEPLPIVSSCRFTGPVPSYTVTGETQVRFLMYVPPAGLTNGVRMLLLTTTGTAASWELYYATGGSMGLRAFDSSGVSLGDSGVIAFAIDGTSRRFSIELTQTGADVAWKMVTLIPGGSGAQFSGTFAGCTVGAITRLFLSPDLNLTDAVQGHASIQTNITSIFDLSSQLAAYVGESAGSRLSRLCGEYGISIGVSGASVAMGAQRTATLTELMQECVDADMGTFYEAPGLFGLGYRTLALNCNQPANLQLSYTAFALAEIPTPLDDDQFTRNDVTVTRLGGSSARAFLADGALSVNDPPAGVGRYDTAVTVNIQSDDDLVDQANWRVHMGTVDEPRFPQVTVNLAHPTFASNPTLRAQVLAVGLGWRITMTDLPVWVSPDEVSLIVLGVTESIDHFQHRVTFNCAPESPYRTALFDSTTVGRLDTDGSQLVQDVTSSGTSLLVATTSGPVWTTTDTPFDIVISGERITVTAVSGATSPQTFTVTRAVNGVVKPLAQGSDVRLFQPMILGL